MSQANSGVWAGRSTFVTLREYLPLATQSWIAVSRRSDEMARSQNSQLQNAVDLLHIGKTTQSYHLNPGDATWLTPAQAGALSVANGAVVPSNYAVVDAFAQQTTSGVVYAANVQTQGCAMNVHQPPAGTDWASDALVADQASFPSPNTGEDPVQMLRVFNDSSIAAPGNNLLFTWLFPSSSIGSRGSIGTAYFNGPAGDPPSSIAQSAWTSANKGSGRYSVKLRLDKTAHVYELAQDGATYIPRFSFNWSTDATPMSWTLVQLTVTFRMWQDTNGNWVGDTISFGQSSSSVSPSQMSSVQSIGELISNTHRYQRGLTPTYKVPRLTGQPMTSAPVRMDVAIDVRSYFNASKFVYNQTSACTITDDIVTFDQPATQTRLLTLVWTGTLPPPTGVTMTLKDQAGNACTATGTSGVTRTATGATAYQQFLPTAQMNGAQPSFTLEPTQFDAPVQTNWALYGPPTYQTTNPVTPITIPFRATPPSLWSQVVESVQIHPQETDPGGENATIVINDLTGDLDSLLEYVNFIPIRVWTTNTSDLANPLGENINLFIGKILVARGKRMRTDPGQTYPGQLWTQWTLECVGEWADVQDATLPRRQIWQNEQTGTNSVVTDCVSNMLASVFSPSMIQVPNSSVQLFGTSPDTYTAEPGARVSDLTNDWMRDYFGGWCLFDESAGLYNQGMMRPFMQKTPPYNNLAVFEMDHPTTIAADGLPRIPQFSNAYPITTTGAQVMQHTFIQAGTFDPHTERAEGNCVIVFAGGGGADAQMAAGSDAAMFTQFAINVNSYNFLNLSPSDPGYPDGTDPAYFGMVKPIRVFRYDLPNQLACDWYCRRIFDRSCFARYYLSFMAPMIAVVDSTDEYQVRPRRLHYSDPVLVRQYNGSLAQFLTVNCSPSYVKDGIQMAHYFLVTQQNINLRAVMPPQKSALAALKKAQARIRGLDVSQGGDYFKDGKQGGHINSNVMALPVPSSRPIQDLLNTSPTFGQFYYLPDYSILGQDIVT